MLVTIVPSKNEKPEGMTGVRDVLLYDGTPVFDDLVKRSQSMGLYKGLSVASPIFISETSIFVRIKSVTLDLSREISSL